MPTDGGLGSGAIRDWNPLELNVWRRVESTWIGLSDPTPEIKKPDGEGWEYGPEVTAFLNALDHFFEQIDPRVQAEGIEWNKGVFTQCLARFEDRAIFREASLWDLITFLRAVTRFSRFPDNNDGGWFADHFATGGVNLAMARLNYLTAPAVEDVERILAYKPTFDRLPLQEFIGWEGGDKIELEGGAEAIQFPWPKYHPVVHEWSEAVYETIFYIDPYHGIKEGKPLPDPKFLNIGEQDHPSPSNLFAKANLATTRQYMAVCIRGEKWCDGFIAGEFERGVIQAAFKRLEQIVEEHQ